MSGRRTLDTVMTILTRFGGKSINLLVFLIVARELSLSEMGIYGIAFSLAFLLSAMLDIGVRNSLAFFIGREEERHGHYTAQAFLLWIALSVLAVPAMLGSLWASGISLNDPQVNQACGVLILAMLYVRMMQGEMLGTGAIARFNRSELASRIILIIMTLGFLVADALTLASALWSLALSQAGAALFLLRSQWPVIRAGLTGGHGLAWKLVSRGFLFMLSVLLMNASKRLGVFAVSHVADDSAAGVYFTLQRLTEVITEVGLAVSVVMFSHSLRAPPGEQATQQAARQAAHSSRVAFLMFVIIAIGLCVTAPFSVPMLLGPKYAGNSELFILIVLATLAGSVWTMVYPTLSVMTSPMTVFALFIPGFAVNAAIILPAMKEFGLAGAALALLVSNIVITLSFLIIFRSRFNVPMRDFIWISRADMAPLLRKMRITGRT